MAINLKREHTFNEDYSDNGGAYEDNSPDDNKVDVDNLPLSERMKVKMYSCGSCSETFKSKGAMKNHLAATLHKAKRGRMPATPRFYCDVCDYGFDRYSDMVKHRRQQHCDPVAPTDENQFNSANADLFDEGPQDTLALAASIIKTEFDENKIECEVEPSTLLDPFLNITQKIEHKEEKSEKVIDTEICDECGSTFAIKTDLKRHVKLRHPNNLASKEKTRRRRKCEITPRFFCDVCPKGFTRRYDMQKHRKQSHANVPEKENALKTKTQLNTELLARCRIEYEGRPHYKCEHCSRVIHLSYNFLRHQTIHTGVRAFFCHLCGKSFRMSSGLNRHIKELHYGVKNYPCDMCGRCFASKNTRDDHMNIHTGARPFICDQCGKSFKQKASLHVHKIFHTNEKPFVCRTCGKKFRRATELKVHGWLHTGYKPHACPTCGSKFRLAQDLKRHQKTHSKDFQVSCEECGACFGQARYLKNHLKTHRKKDALAAGLDIHLDTHSTTL